MLDKTKNMIFNLVEKTKRKIESFTLINIDEENCDIDKTVTITAPVHKNIAGVYKYGNMEIMDMYGL